MTELPDEQIAEWVALADAATEGPWRVADDAEPHDAAVLTPGGYLSHSPDDGVRGGSDIADAAFIAAARSAVPALAAALSSARAENERHETFMRAIAECRKDPASAIAQNDIINGKALIRAYDVEQDNDRLRAENAALRESLNVSAERAAGDRRALDEAQAKVQDARVTVLAQVRVAVAHYSDADLTRDAVERLCARLAAAQPTESAP